MKKLGLILMSVALVLGMAQCKKNNDVITSGVTGDGTRTITLKVNDNGSKISVNPNTGAVGFTKGDVIYAAYNGKYAGTLTHNGSDFTGSISTSGDSGKKLTFYFMGNKTPSEGTLSSSTTSLTVSIFDQTENYPVISVGLSNEDYASGTDTYTATLNNQCALVKFNVTTESAYAPTIITGVNDKVQVTFADGAIGTYVYSQYRGAVKVAGGGGERWAILLPQDAAGMGVAYSGDLCYNGTHGMIPAITENGYLTAGVNVNVSSALDGFSVASGTKVHFAPGNLQAVFASAGTSCTWRFADNQYDYIGDAAANTSINGSGSVSAAGTVDLFGFNGASSSYNNYGINDSKDNSDYGATTSETLKSDWGNNAITNSYGHTWRTLTNAEQGYIYNSRTGCPTVNGVENAKYAKTKVNGTFGVMVFPDSFTWPSSVSTVPITAHINIGSGSYSDSENFTLAEWTLLEANGAVFLPAAGYRLGASVSYPGSRGYYWSGTAHGSTAGNAYNLRFLSDTNWNPQHNNNRYNGFSVRLVCE